MSAGIIIAYLIGYLVGWLSTRQKISELRKKNEALEEFIKFTRGDQCTKES